MTVVSFKRPPKGGDPRPSRRSLGEFAATMGLVGLVIFLVPTLWSGAPQMLLAAIHLPIAVVYFQQGPRVAAALWIALSLALLFLTGAPSPVAYALQAGAGLLDSKLGL